MFQAIAGQRQVTFSWSPPPFFPGVTGYTLTCVPSPTTLPLSSSQSGSFTVGGFTPNTFYSCSVVANYNDTDQGRPANLFFTTLEDCKIDNTSFCIILHISADSYFQLRLRYDDSCLEFRVSKLHENSQLL